MAYQYRPIAVCSRRIAITAIATTITTTGMVTPSTCFDAKMSLSLFTFFVMLRSSDTAMVAAENSDPVASVPISEFTLSTTTTKAFTSPIATHTRSVKTTAGHPAIPSSATEYAATTPASPTT